MGGVRGHVRPGQQMRGVGTASSCGLGAAGTAHPGNGRGAWAGHTLGFLAWDASWAILPPPIQLTKCSFPP